MSFYKKQFLEIIETPVLRALQAHWNNTFPKHQYVFFFTLSNPHPHMVKDHTFPTFFEPFP